MREKLAIIGSGITGMGAAYRLRNRNDITIFEKNNYVGGHTNTVTTEEGERTLNIDTGFIVYNETTYPLLTKLFAELGIRTENSNMSFSVDNRDLDLQWSARTIGSLFAQRRNLLRPRFYKLLLEANRFNQNAYPDLLSGKAADTIGDYLRRNGYSDYFAKNYVLPMGSAVWSTPADRMADFPAQALIGFFHHHGFLGWSTQLQWRTVTGGARHYMQAIAQRLSASVRINEPALRVRRRENSAHVQTRSGELSFDRVLLATHADEALDLLETPTDTERRLLGAFSYSSNRAVLHTDVSCMPSQRRVWAAWNYKISKQGDRTLASTVYYMNLLQNLRTDKHYFVSINDFDSIAPEKIVRTFDYMHPLFTQDALQAQAHLGQLNNGGRVLFAGSYFRNGFHEDALWAGTQAANRLLEVSNHELVSV